MGTLKIGSGIVVASAHPVAAGDRQAPAAEGAGRDPRPREDIIAPYQAFRNAIEYLQAHLAEEISIEHLARLSRMSTSTFEREFKRHFRLSPRQFIWNLKVYEAFRLRACQSIHQS